MPDKKEEFGQIQIADEVVAVIAATAAMEIEGVLNASSASGNAFVEFFGKKSQTKGVKINSDGGELTLELDIVVLFGTKIQTAATEVQKKVKSAVETMTGLTVAMVNVNVCGIVKEKQPKAPKNEIEQE